VFLPGGQAPGSSRFLLAVAQAGIPLRRGGDVTAAPWLLPADAVCHRRRVAGKPLSTEQPAATSPLMPPGGSALISAELLAACCRDPFPAIASYNAGPGAVQAGLSPSLQNGPEPVGGRPFLSPRDPALSQKKVLGNLWTTSSLMALRLRGSLSRRRKMPKPASPYPEHHVGRSGQWRQGIGGGTIRIRVQSSRATATDVASNQHVGQHTQPQQIKGGDGDQKKVRPGSSAGWRPSVPKAGASTVDGIVQRTTTRDGPENIPASRKYG